MTQSTKISRRSDASSYPDDALVETMWRELDGQVSRERIRRVVAEIAATYQDAAVQAFVPIFTRRNALAILKESPEEKEL